MSEELTMEALESVSGGKIYKDAIGKVEITDCKHGVYAKQEPDGNSANVQFVHLGERFYYYGTTGSWTKIKCYNGKYGFVRTSKTTVVERFCVRTDTNPF